MDISSTYALYVKKKNQMIKRLEGHSHRYYHYKHNLLSNGHECQRNKLFCNSVPSYWQLSCRKPIEFSLQWTRRFHFTSVTFARMHTDQQKTRDEKRIFFFLSLNRHALLLNRQQRSHCCFFLFLTVARFSEERDANKQEFSEQDWPSDLTFNFSF